MQRSTRAWSIVLVTALLFVAIVFTHSSRVEAAGMWYVSSFGDDTQSCQTLEDACRTIAAAMQKAQDSDTIHLDRGIYFENLSISKDLTIRGIGTAPQVILDGGETYRPMSICINAEVILAQVTIQHGRQPNNDTSCATYANGGAIANYGDLTLDNVVIQDNSADIDGAIFNRGSLSITDSLIQGNSASQGSAAVMNNGGTTTILRSTIRDNVGQDSAGIIFNSSNADMTIDASAIIVNTGGHSGGIYNGGQLTVTNSTISGNTSTNLAGALYQWSAAVLTNVTVADNHSPSTGGDLFLGSSSTTTVRNTIVSSTSPTCGGSGVLASLGGNIDSKSLCRFTADDDQSDVNPGLGPLGNYGGATLTHNLRDGSPAIDRGSNQECPAEDQRGMDRPRDGNGDGSAICDIGAYERAADELTPTPSATSTSTHTAIPTATSTDTATSTPPATNTHTATPTSTHNATTTSTSTNTPTKTDTPLATPTWTVTSTGTPTIRPSTTTAPTATSTESTTPKPSIGSRVHLPLVIGPPPPPTPTATVSPSHTPTATRTPTNTAFPISTNTPTETSTSTNTPTATQTPTETRPPSGVPVLSSSTYTSSGTGSRYIVGEVRNDTSSNVKFVKIVVSLYDAGGTLVRTDFGYADMDIMRPGQRSPFDILITDPPATYASYRLQVEWRTTSEQPIDGVVILSHATRPASSADRQYIFGEVRNDSGGPVEFVRIAATMYDSAGSVVAVDFGYTELDELSAGQTSPFEFVVTHWVNVARYELQIQARRP